MVSPVSIMAWQLAQIQPATCQNPRPSKQERREMKDSDADADRTGKNDTEQSINCVKMRKKERKKIRQWGRLCTVEGSGGASWATQFRLGWAQKWTESVTNKKTCLLMYMHTGEAMTMRWISEKSHCAKRGIEGW